MQGNQEQPGRDWRIRYPLPQRSEVFRQATSNLRKMWGAGVDEHFLQRKAEEFEMNAFMTAENPEHYLKTLAAILVSHKDPVQSPVQQQQPQQDIPPNSNMQGNQDTSSSMGFGAVRQTHAGPSTQITEHQTSLTATNMNRYQQAQAITREQAVMGSFTPQHGQEIPETAGSIELDSMGLNSATSRMSPDGSRAGTPSAIRNGRRNSLAGRNHQPDTLKASGQPVAASNRVPGSNQSNNFMRSGIARESTQDIGLSGHVQPAVHGGHKFQGLNSGVSPSPSNLRREGVRLWYPRPARTPNSSFSVRNRKRGRPLAASSGTSPMVTAKRTEHQNVALPSSSTNIASFQGGPSSKRDPPVDAGMSTVPAGLGTSPQNTGSCQTPPENNPTPQVQSSAHSVNGSGHSAPSANATTAEVLPGLRNNKLNITWISLADLQKVFLPGFLYLAPLLLKLCAYTPLPNKKDIEDQIRFCERVLKAGQASTPPRYETLFKIRKFLLFVIHDFARQLVGLVPGESLPDATKESMTNLVLYCWREGEAWSKVVKSQTQSPVAPVSQQSSSLQGQRDPARLRQCQNLQQATNPRAEISLQQQAPTGNQQLPQSSLTVRRDCNPVQGNFLREPSQQNASPTEIEVVDISQDLSQTRTGQLGRSHLATFQNFRTNLQMKVEKSSSQLHSSGETAWDGKEGDFRLPHNQNSPPNNDGHIAEQDGEAVEIVGPSEQSARSQQDLGGQEYLLEDPEPESISLDPITSTEVIGSPSSGNVPDLQHEQEERHDESGEETKSISSTQAGQYERAEVSEQTVTTGTVGHHVEEVAMNPDPGQQNNTIPPNLIPDSDQPSVLPGTICKQVGEHQVVEDGIFRNADQILVHIERADIIEENKTANAGGVNTASLMTTETSVSKVAVETDAIVEARQRADRLDKVVDSAVRASELAIREIEVSLEKERETRVKETLEILLRNKPSLDDLIEENGNEGQGQGNTSVCGENTRLDDFSTASQTQNLLDIAADGSQVEQNQGPFVQDNRSLRQIAEDECKIAMQSNPLIVAKIEEEFRKPVVHCMLKIPAIRLPKLIVRIQSGYTCSALTYAFERPPLGWIGCLADIKSLFEKTLSEVPMQNKGVAACLSAWAQAADKVINGSSLSE